MKENNLTVPIAIIVAGIVIAGAIFLSGGEKAPVTTDKAVKIEVTSEDHIFGNPDAKLVIVEYSDTECPFCKRFHETMNEVMDSYGKEGTVAWVYRHMPLEGLHKKAKTEATATECAAEQGGNDAFWSYINRMFEITPSNDGLDLAKLPEIASELGLDVDLFNTCLESNKYDDKLQASIDRAVELGARGTPYSLVTSQEGEVLYVVGGAEPFSSLAPRLDQLLAE